MKILLLPKYHREGPSSRYRLFNYIKYFEDRGHEVHVKPLLYEGYVKNLYSKSRNSKIKMLRSLLDRLFFLVKNKKIYDMIIIEKELFTNCPYFIEKLILMGCRYSVDYDDAVSINYKSSRIKSLLFGNKINGLSGKAVLTTVGNRWYPNEIVKGNLVYLPTVIDITKYDAAGMDEKEDKVPVIVWIGSPSTAHYLDAVSRIFKNLAENNRFKLKVIGADVRIEGVDCVYIPWSKENEFRELYTSDIGIMPLLDTRWEKGKCGFKLIQYMASFLPTVASPAPANEEITVQGETGFIAGNNDEWEKYLLMLINDAELRKRMGSAARKRVEDNYTYQVWGDRFVNMIESFGEGIKNVRN